MRAALLNRLWPSKVRRRQKLYNHRRSLELLEVNLLQARELKVGRILVRLLKRLLRNRKLRLEKRLESLDPKVQVHPQNQRRVNLPRRSRPNLRPFSLSPSKTSEE
jgi:hypothetical protein